MTIVIKDNIIKRYMYTELYIENNNMDASKLFDDLNIVVEEDKAAGIVIDRHHPAQKLLNRFSAQYFSPTGVKGFRDCPASQILQSLLPFVPNAATAIGTTVHSVLEEFYELDGPERDIELLDGMLDKQLANNNQKDIKEKITPYIDGFKETPDYLDKNKPMNHKDLVCYNELFLKGKFSPLGVELPYSMYSLCDRVDFRGDYAYIIDYKTGMYLRPQILTMDGYLPQLMSYKWAVEETYGVEVKGGVLLVPGTKQKIATVDINSLENQSKYIDMIFKYKEDSQMCAKRRMYPVKSINKWLQAKLDEFADIEENNGITTIKIKYETTLKDNEIK